MTIDRGRQYTSLYIQSRRVLEAGSAMWATSLEQKGRRLQSTCHKSPASILILLSMPLQLDLISSFIIEGSRDAREVKHHVISFHLSSLMMKVNWCIKYQIYFGFGLVFLLASGARRCAASQTINMFSSLPHLSLLTV